EGRKRWCDGESVIAAEKLLRRDAIDRRNHKAQIEALKLARQYEISIVVFEPIGVLLKVRNDSVEPRRTLAAGVHAVIAPDIFSRVLSEGGWSQGHQP